jgi:hypothetical protein
VSFYGVNPNGKAGKLIVLAFNARTVDKLERDAQRMTITRAALLRLILRAWYSQSETTRRGLLLLSAQALAGGKSDEPVAARIPLAISDATRRDFLAESRERGISRNALGRLIVHAYLTGAGGLEARREAITRAATEEAVEIIEHRKTKGLVR